MTNIVQFPPEKQRDLFKSYKVHKGKLQDKLLCWFEVEIQYYYFTDGTISIESYELEEDNVDRDELVEMFGEHTVKLLEEQIC